MPEFVLGVHDRAIGQTDWTDPDSVAKAARSLILCREYKQRYEKRAYRNKSILFGDQWYIWNRYARRMTEDDNRQRWQAQLTYNYILSIIEQRVSQMIRDERVFSAVPATQDERDKVAARMKDQVYNAYWFDKDKMNMPPKLREALQWALSSSTVWGHPYWNKEKGPPLTVAFDDFLQSAQQQVNPAIQQTGAPQEASDQFALQMQQPDVQMQAAKFAALFGQQALQQGAFNGNQGEMDFRIAPIFEVGYWPFYPKTWDDPLVWSETLKLPIARASEITGIDEDEVRAVAPYAPLSAYGDSRWAEDYYDAGDSSQASAEFVYLTTIWRKPCGKYQHGREALVLGFGGKVAYLDDIRNASNEVPLFPLVEKPIRGQAPGTCTVDQLIGPQQNINTSLSQIADYRNKRIMPTLVQFTGDSATGQQLSNAPGKFYRCNNPELVPRPIEMPDIGRDYFNTYEVDKAFMQEISGVSGVDIGQTNQRSGRAIINLQQRNLERLGPFAGAVDEWVEAIGNHTDREIQFRVQGQRILNIVGKNNELEVVKFTGQQLRGSQTGAPGEPRNLIRCKAFSNFPKSQSEILNFLNVALSTTPPMLDPIRDRDKILQMTGMGDYRAMFDRTRTDHANAQDVIDHWEAGQPAGPASSYCDHQTFYDVLNSWAKTESYKRAVAAVGQQMQMMAMQHGINPAQLPANPLAQDIDDRIYAHKRGIIEDQLETIYLQRAADIDLWISARERLMRQDPVNGKQIADMFYPLPLGVGAPMPGSVPQKNPQNPNAPQQTNPPQKSSGKNDDGGKKKPRTDKQRQPDSDTARATAKDKSESQTAVQRES